MSRPGPTSAERTALRAPVVSEETRKVFRRDAMLHGAGARGAWLLPTKSAAAG